MSRHGCFKIKSHQQDITIILMFKKTTTSTCKNHKFSRKVQEESVAAILTTSISLKMVSMIQWRSSLSLGTTQIGTLR